jgi:DNA repair protein RadC
LFFVKYVEPLKLAINWAGTGVRPYKHKNIIKGEHKVCPYKNTNMTEKPHYFEHRKRLRERFQKAGTEGLHDYELLELLLTYAILRKDVKLTAKNLIDRFGNISGVLDASQSELESIKGLGSVSATLIRLVKELCGIYLSERMKGRDLLSSPQSVVDFARMRLAGLPHDAFMVIYLNAKNEAIEHEIIHEGTVDRAIIYPRRIIESALAYHASGLILIHNHPSGHPEPSEEDKRLTRAVTEAAKTMDLRVVDHIIVGKNGYFSFMEERLL